MSENFCNVLGCTIVQVVKGVLTVVILCGCERCTHCGYIIVVGALTHVLHHFMCDLKATHMNVQ